MSAAFSRRFHSSVPWHASAWLLVAGLLCACSLTGPVVDKQVFDLTSPPAAGSQVSESRMQTIAIAPVSTSQWLDSTGLVYRLAYLDPQQPKHYANSQWSGVPAELLTRQLRHQFARQANVVSEGDTLNTVVLKVDLEEFSQIFDSSDKSHVVMAFQATLIRGGKLIAQRSFFAEQMAATPDASGGAHALASLSTGLVQQVANWSLGYLS